MKTKSPSAQWIARTSLHTSLAVLLTVSFHEQAFPAESISDGTSNTIQIGENSRFNNGSSGLLGDIVIDADRTIDLPADGILHLKSLKVSSGKTLRFKRNALNTPAYLLAQQDVVIEGIIDVSGSQSPNDIPTGGVGGPGGFDGGKPGFGEVPPGAGYGPGAGKGGTTDSNAANGAGSGSYATISLDWNNPNKGPSYGSKLLIPLIGGSGGGGATGSPGRGGGGGGGALLISSNTRIQHTGRILAFGGAGNGAGGNVGSGGAVRFVAPVVAGAGEVNVFAHNDWAGRGRIRVDTVDRSDLRFKFEPVDSLSVGANMFIFPPLVPTLDIVEVAGNQVPLGSGPVNFQLPFGSSPNRDIKVQASGWGRIVPIQVVLTPDSGAPTIFNAEINNGNNLVQGDGSVRNVSTSMATVPVVFPVNTLVTIHCWTRSSP
ncbi:MAG: hypothetical protein L0Z50_31065 [Verrucomicrobiales bacterium]|nr:hypothetical protein [Verrucomicrobiales bacterium]